MTISRENQLLWRQTVERNSELYAESLRKNGPSHRALRWGSKASQLARFDALCSIGDLRGKRIVDVGSGLGDFYAFLSDLKIEIDYTGLDITQAMVENAQQRFPEVEFRVCDLLSVNFDEIEESTYDFAFASGIFTFCDHLPYDYMVETVRRMFRMVRLGVAFNCISSWGDKPEPGECQFDPIRCLDNISGMTHSIVLRHDYLPHDFTVVMHKIRE